MRTRETPTTFTIPSITTPSATVIDTNRFAGGMFSRADTLVVDVAASVTGGTLDVYLQRKVSTNTWREWAHFPQLAAGQSKAWTLSVTGEGPMVSGNIITEVGQSTDAVVTTSALAASASPNCVPGGDIRIVYVTGSGVSAGSITATITPYLEFG